MTVENRTLPRAPIGDMIDHVDVAGRTPVDAARETSDLVRLPGGKWTIWPFACLRGAGFPAADVLRLSSPVCVRLAIDLLRLRASPKARAASGEHGERLAGALETLQATFAAETRRMRAVLQEAAADPAFREAVVWQNRRAFAHSVNPLIGASPDSGSSDTRKRELLVASYLQRYCVKNDTIGFFGPVGWVRFRQTGPAIAAEYGPTLVADRRLYFESWCIDAIAQALDQRPELRPWALPRIAASVRVESGQVMIGSRVVLTLSADEARLFAACDGTDHAQAIARRLCAAGSDDFPTAAAVYDRLEQWQQAGYLAWTFEGPLEARPERTLRGRLGQIDDPEIRARPLAELEVVEAAARAVDEAAGNAEYLDRALGHFEETFTQATQRAPTRWDGEMYASRTLLYEDCRRDASVSFGTDFLTRLGPPLSLVLQSARWAVHELARQHEIGFRAAFAALGGSPDRPVGLGAFLSKTSFFGNGTGTLSPIDAAVRTALEQRWVGVLSPPAGARRVQYRGRDLRTAVRAAFESPAAPPSMWARHVSPDVMIDAAGADAIERGDYRFVLGELHILNTLLTAVFPRQHPRPDDILWLLDRDCREPRVVWIGAKETTPHRVQIVLRPHDYGYVTGREPSPASVDRTLRVADLVVADEAGALVVRTRDGRTRFPCFEFFATPAMRTGASLFSVLPSAPHRPRITIDHLIVAREQWRVPASEVRFATRGDQLDRFVECQRWAHQLELPSFVFVKMPTERKPTYVDLSSPVFVDLFARFVRNLQRVEPAGIISITEMLPRHSGAWLADAAGRRYTSEIRIVAVDPSVTGQRPDRSDVDAQSRSAE